MPEPDVYTIAVDDVPESPEEIFGPRPAGITGERGIIVPAKRKGSESSGSAVRVGMSNRQPGRVPAASSMSLLLCGAGQIFNGQVKLGLLLFLVEALFFISHKAMIASWSSILAFGSVVGLGEAGMLITVAAIDFSMVLFIPAVVYHAYRRAESDHGDYEGVGSSFISGLASMLVPGWGQLLNAQVGKAVFFLFSILSALWVAVFLLYTPILAALSGSMGELATQRVIGGGVGILIAATLMWVLSIYDAVLVSSFRRHRS
jgi:hypothetical protein